MEIIKTPEGLYSVSIEGVSYEFEKWGAEEQLDTLLDIIPIIGKPLGITISQVMSGDKKSLLDNEFDLEKIFDAITTNFDKKTIKQLIMKLSSSRVLVNGAKINFGQYYSDKLALMFKVAFAGLEVQYGNFFGDVITSVGMKARKPLSNKELTQ